MVFMYLLVVYKIKNKEIKNSYIASINTSYEKLFNICIHNEHNIYRNGEFQYACIKYIDEMFPMTEYNQQWFKYDVKNNYGNIINSPKNLIQYVDAIETYKRLGY